MSTCLCVLSPSSLLMLSDGSPSRAGKWLVPHGGSSCLCRCFNISISCGTSLHWQQVEIGIKAPLIFQKKLHLEKKLGGFKSNAYISCTDGSGSQNMFEVWLVVGNPNRRYRHKHLSLLEVPLNTDASPVATWPQRWQHQAAWFSFPARWPWSLFPVVFILFHELLWTKQQDLKF